MNCLLVLRQSRRWIIPTPLVYMCTLPHFFWLFQSFRCFFFKYFKRVHNAHTNCTWIINSKAWINVSKCDHMFSFLLVSWHFGSIFLCFSIPFFEPSLFLSIALINISNFKTCVYVLWKYTHDMFVLLYFPRLSFQCVIGFTYFRLSIQVIFFRVPLSCCTYILENACVYVHISCFHSIRIVLIVHFYLCRICVCCFTC